MNDEELLSEVRAKMDRLRTELDHDKERISVYRQIRQAFIEVEADTDEIRREVERVSPQNEELLAQIGDKLATLRKAVEMLETMQKYRRSPT